MKFDAVSFVPQRSFRSEAGGIEFETDTYCLGLDRAITLHLKTTYLDRLLGDTDPELRQIRKWYFYTAHLNCLYLLLDALVVRDLHLYYFDLEEITTKNANVVSPNGVSISPHSRRHQLSSMPGEEFVLTKEILEAVNREFLTATSDFERVYVLSEVAKSLGAYKSGDFTTSFVLAWFLLERFVESIWTSYLESQNRDMGHGEKRINSERRKSLTDPRSYPISVKLQILELAQKLSFAQFSVLDTLRGKRNDIVHPGKVRAGDATAQGDHDSCGEAFVLLQEFIESAFGLRLTLNISYSFLGIFERQCE